MLNVHSQNSVSVGFRRSLEGIGFKQHQFNASYAWLNDYSEFSLGLGLIPKKLNYSLEDVDSHYSHGPPGYYINTQKTASKSAEISYFYLTPNFEIKAVVMNLPSFKLFIGAFFQFNIRLNESEMNHQTDLTTTTNSAFGGPTTTTTTDSPTSYEVFDAISTPKFIGTLGLKCSARQYFGAWFLEGNLSIGVNSARCYTDNLSSLNYSNYFPTFNYELLTEREIPFFLSSGLSIGYSF